MYGYKTAGWVYDFNVKISGYRLERAQRTKYRLLINEKLKLKENSILIQEKLETLNYILFTILEITFKNRRKFGCRKSELKRKT